MAEDENVHERDGLAKRMLGVWWLRTRQDFAEDGSRRIGPILGEDPVGILTYAPERFAAQFMKRDRCGEPLTAAAPIGQDNTGAVGGYDAYFGA
jgi:hypothetical protein